MIDFVYRHHELIRDECVQPQELTTESLYLVDPGSRAD